MGNTLVQRRVFTLLMCFFMVVGMTAYNILLHTGWSEHFVIDLLKEVWIVFIVALTLDIYVVGPIVNKIVINRIEENTPLSVKILFISSSMVILMVTFMSFGGTIISSDFGISNWSVYPMIWIRNFIFAWPLNLFIVNPTVRFIFQKIYKNRT